MSKIEQEILGMLREEELTPEDKALRNLFISEYMKDNDRFLATIRAGFPAAFALEWQNKLYFCPYVQRALMNLKRKPNEDSDETKRAEWLDSLRTLMKLGPETSRVAATKAYGEAMGYTDGDKGDDPDSGLIEVMRQLATRLPV